MRLNLKGLGESVLGNAIWAAVYAAGSVVFVWVSARKPLEGPFAFAVHAGVGVCFTLFAVVAWQSLARWRSTARPQAAENQMPPSAPANVGAAPPPPDLVLNVQDQAKLEAYLRAERATAVLWEYRYLNFFLAEHTQRVLDWLAGLPGAATIHLFEVACSTQIPELAERNRVLEALANHHLIQITGVLLEITDKGRDYRAWRGPLPPPPSASSAAPSHAPHPRV